MVLSIGAYSPGNIGMEVYLVFFRVIPKQCGRDEGLLIPAGSNMPNLDSVQEINNPFIIASVFWKALFVGWGFIQAVIFWLYSLNYPQV